MASGAPVAEGLLEWGVSAHPLPGQTACGDLHLVQAFPGGALVLAVDALGHGPEAEESARTAIAAALVAIGDPIPLLIRRIHRELIGRRGVVLSVGMFDAAEGVLTWAGVGNVEGLLSRGGRRVPSTSSGLVILGGVVGGDLPDVRPQQLPVEPGDLLLFATDGVDRGFVRDVDPRLPVGQIAEELLTRHSKGTDDAMVLVARYLGSAT